MNNLSSYCGLVDAKIRASDKDLLVQIQYMKIPSSEHGENMLCTEIVCDIQNNFCTQHVLQKEEILTKICLY